MTPGLMQQRPLQIIDILKFAASAHPSVAERGRSLLIEGIDRAAAAAE